MANWSQQLNTIIRFLIHKIKLLPSEPLVRSVLFDSETDLLEDGDEVGEEDSENEDERSSPTSAIFVHFALYKWKRERLDFNTVGESPTVPSDVRFRNFPEDTRAPGNNSSKKLQKK